MGVADYLVGKRVYNGYSSSPHRSTNLDPMGYIERDADGGRRSGLAAAAAQRLNMQPASPTTLNTQEAASKVKSTVAPPPDMGGLSPERIHQMEQQYKNLRRKTSRSATGKVKKKKKKPGADLLPLDPAIAQMRIALNRARAQALQDFARTGRNINQDYGIAVRGQKEKHPLEVAQLLGSAGARGMGESGGTTVNRTRLEKSFQDTLAELARTKARGLGDLSAAKKAYLNNYQTQLERLLIQQAERASQEAGSLGMKALLKKYLKQYG